MAYLNTTFRGSQSSGSTEIEIPRYTPLNPAESPDSDGSYPSGVIDTSHAIKVGDIVFSASNAGVGDQTRVTEVVPTSSDVTTIRLTRGLVSDVEDGTWLTFDHFQNATKGGKFSFSKYPVPSITDQVPLFDIVSGQPLVDENGVELVTDTEVAVGEVARKDNATSVTIPTGVAAPSVPVEEIFQQTSETSNNLLGIPRAERQLSLFSDVSTLGLNEDDWEFYLSRSKNGLKFGPWDLRDTEIFGPHYYSSFIEQTEEQALEIGAFPVPYSYPFGERWAQFNFYDEDRYEQYVNFVQLGNLLYTYYSTSEREAEYGVDFKNNFLDGSKVRIDDNNDTEFVGITDDEGFKLIDDWTRTWVDINDGIFFSPVDGSPITAVIINNITSGDPLFSNTRPGYNTDFQQFAYLQSKRTYRYQPGRISGFTFGVRASSDSGSEQNILEWGVTNETDQYVFQLKGATFNIVRRSTIPLENDVVEAQGLDPLEDQVLKPSGDPEDLNEETRDPKEYFTIEIPRDNWNVDPLNGNGPSGYLLTSEEVTMYKIEFSWYGAIGANFYVYIPVQNGEARWVLVHRLVIENKLGQPCLENPNFRFRYSVNIRDTARLRRPQFVYKYGASMYIDGGDEGTVTLHSYSSGSRGITSGQDTSVLGVYPKGTITNKEGTEKVNNKTIIPKSLSVTSDAAAHVKVAKCTACPGFGHNYNLGLKSGEIGRLASFKFNDQTLSSITINPQILDATADDLFQLEDNDAKIIVDGIYSTYIQVDEDSSVIEGGNIIGYRSANLVRIGLPRYLKTPISSTSSAQSPSNGFDSSGTVILQNDTRRNLLDYAGDEGDVYPDQMRISRFEAYAASDIPITGTEIDIQFLSPRPRESLSHFAEYRIGLTDRRPIDDNGVLKFEIEPTVFSETLPSEDTLFGDFTQSNAGKDRFGFDDDESNFPFEDIFEIDYRIPPPEKEDETDKTGKCSRARFNILPRQQLSGEFTLTNPDTGIQDGNVYFSLDEGVRFPLDSSIVGGELGIDGSGTGVTFTSEEQTYITGGQTRAFASVTEFPSGLSDGSAATVELTPITLMIHRDRNITKSKIFRFNPFPLYAFVAMRDNSEIHSISVKERVGNSQVTSTPNWITTTGGSMEIDTSGGRAVSGLSPINFTPQNRLDSATIDNQNNQRMRPVSVKDSFFLGANETEIYDLDNIYNFDREVVVPNIFDTEATFFLASTTDEATGDIQITLNTAEQ